MSHLAQVTHFPDSPDGGFQTFHRTQSFTAAPAAVAPGDTDIQIPTRKKKKEPTQ